MTWTPIFPTIRGPYWLRRSPDEEPMLVFATPTTPNDWWYYPIYSTRGDRFHNLDKETAIWYGPIEPPDNDQAPQFRARTASHEDARILDGEVA